MMRFLQRMLAYLRSYGLTFLRGVPREEFKEVADTLSLVSARLHVTRAALENLERVIGSEVGRRVVDKIGHDMSGAVRRHITEAIIKARQCEGESAVPTWLKLELSSSELAWLDPGSLERRVLEEWKEQSAPKLRAFVDLDNPIAIERSVTVLDVRVPQLGYRQHIHN